jgi:hypothetical protein
MAITLDGTAGITTPAATIGGASAVTTDATQTLTNKSIAASQLTGALPAISGASLTNLPAPTSADVGTAIAGLASAAVGTHMFGIPNNSTTYAFGATIAGSLLRPCAAYVNTALTTYSANAGTAVSGTWTCLGNRSGTTASAIVTLFVRTA